VIGVLARVGQHGDVRGVDRVVETLRRSVLDEAERSISMVISEATSPAACPPMPSATMASESST
jgi:hypothetical protein